MERTGTADTAAHWQQVHRDRPADEVSWFEPTPVASLEMFGELGVGTADSVIDVGAGSSALAASLLGRGHRDVTALDVSDAALRAARERLGERADDVRWVVADLLTWRPTRRYDVWHDRAVFHFLTTEHERERYRAALREAVSVGGLVVVGTFAGDGPGQCSGLPTCGYGVDGVMAALGLDLDLLAARRIEHRTPSDAVQPFTWVGARRV